MSYTPIVEIKNMKSNKVWPILISEYNPDNNPEYYHVFGVIDKLSLSHPVLYKLAYFYLVGYNYSSSRPYDILMKDLSFDELDYMITCQIDDKDFYFMWYFGKKFFIDKVINKKHNEKISIHEKRFNKLLNGKNVI